MQINIYIHIFFLLLHRFHVAINVLDTAVRKIFIQERPDHLGQAFQPEISASTDRSYSLDFSLDDQPQDLITFSSHDVAQVQDLSFLDGKHQFFMLIHANENFIIRDFMHRNMNISNASINSLNLVSEEKDREYIASQHSNPQLYSSLTKNLISAKSFQVCLILDLISYPVSHCWQIYLSNINMYRVVRGHSLF